jgi:hypothetical protein
MISLLHELVVLSFNRLAGFRKSAWLASSLAICLTTTLASTLSSSAESSFAEALPFFNSLANISAIGWNSTPMQSESMSAAPSSDPLTPVLLEYGCLGRAKRLLQRGQRQILINVYDFATTAGAYGAYCYLRQGSSNVITKGDASSEDQQSISFCKGNFFVSIYGTANDDDESKSLVTSISNQLAAAIPSDNTRLYGARPEILLRLPTFEVVKGSQKLIMGPLAAKKFLLAPYVTTLGAEKMQMGAIADYQLQEPDRERLKLLIAQYPNPIAAMHVYTKYISELEAQHKPENLEGLSYQSSVYKTTTGHILCQLRGQTFLIITGARKKNSLAALASQVY